MNIEDSRLVKMAATAGSRTDFWIQWLPDANVRVMLEIGVWKGDYAKEILQRCEFIDRYYMIDPWANLADWNKPLNVKQQVFDDVHAEAMEKTAFAAQKRLVLRGRTKDVIDEIPDGSLDFAYIDGDHTLRGITIDLIQVLPKIKVGGFIGGDDFCSSPWQHDVRFEPTLVCPFSIYFAEAMALPIVALPFDQFLIQKRSDVSFSFTDPTAKYADLSLNRLAIPEEKNGMIHRAKRKIAKLVG